MARSSVRALARQSPYLLAESPASRIDVIGPIWRGYDRWVALCGGTRIALHPGIREGYEGTRGLRRARALLLPHSISVSLAISRGSWIKIVGMVYLASWEWLVGSSQEASAEVWQVWPS